MFTDLLQLPYTNSQYDQVLSLSYVSWSEYENLVEQNRSALKIDFLFGNVTIVSPSRNHEAIYNTVIILVAAYCRYAKIDYFPTGSTTLKDPGRAGKEPDCSFNFGMIKDIPDLAVEVIYRSGNVEDILARYLYFKVPEVWIWQDEKLSFYQLENSGYQWRSPSLHLPHLNSSELVRFVNRGRDESLLRIEQDFEQTLANLPGK